MKLLKPVSGRMGTSSRKILGTSIACSGMWKSRCRHDQRVVDDLFHGAPLDLSCDLTLKSRLSRAPPELQHAVVQEEVLRAWLSGSGVAVKFISRPGRLLALCAMVRVRGQGRSDRLLLVSPPRAQSSLPPPHCGSSGAVGLEPPAGVRLEK